jgi:hypothetical protein
MKKTLIIIIIAVAVLFVVIFVARLFSGPEDTWICEGTKWVKHGNPSTPMPQGSCEKKSAKTDAKQPATLKVDSLKINDRIASPVIVSGQASGWYFEGAFLVRVVDETGKELGRGNAVALDGNWMTTNFVPFKGSVTFDPQGAKDGKIIFEKANPSGLPQNAESYSLPVSF